MRIATRLLNIMKLLYLHHIAIDSQKANIVQVLQMCHAFQQAGVDVTLAVPMCESGVGNMDVLRSELGVDVKFKIKEYKKYRWRGRPMLLGAYWGIKKILENSSEYDYCYVRNSFLAELSVKIISAPNSSNIMTIGNNHHFLRTLRKSQNSLIIDNLLIKLGARFILRKFV